MAKRRAEDTLFPDSSSKRCYRSLCGVEMQSESTAPDGGVRPPSLVALCGSSCKKRPYNFEGQEQQQQDASLYRKTTHSDIHSKLAANILTMQTSGTFQDHGSSVKVPSPKRRHREESVGLKTVNTKAEDKAAADAITEDCSYNSFQFWRVPLPELDLSLLEDSEDHSQTKHKSKDKNSLDAMES